MYLKCFCLSISQSESHRVHSSSQAHPSWRQALHWEHTCPPTHLSASAPLSAPLSAPACWGAEWCRGLQALGFLRVREWTQRVWVSDTLQVVEVRLSPLRGVYATFTWTYPVHFKPPVVNGCNLLDHRLHGRVHSGVEKKLALVRALHMQLHHPVKELSTCSPAERHDGRAQACATTRWPPLSTRCSHNTVAIATAQCGRF